ncbi:hypothetical protein KKC65_02825 [Patescibacteria group bacterium]|nr:hypothetical protein [Patescibacteria group bacterium]
METRDKEKREYFWYVQPLDSHTNEVVSAQLPEKSEDSFSKKGSLWECSIEFVTSLYASRADFNLKFEIWGKQGHQGKMTKKTFLFKPKNKRLKMRKKKTKC